MKRKLIHSIIFVIATVVIFTITTFAIDFNQGVADALPVPDVHESIWLYEISSYNFTLALFDCDLDTLLPVIRCYRGVDILSYLGLVPNPFIDDYVLIEYPNNNYDDLCRMIVLYDNYYDKVDEANYLSSEMERLDTEKNALIGECAGLSQIINNLEASILALETEIEALETEIEALEYTNDGLREYNNEAYNNGYNDGMTNAEVFKGGLITIFSAPLYVFGEAFNFEIFGVNIFSIIQFIITIAIAYHVIKFIR